MSFWQELDDGADLSPGEKELRDKFVNEYLFDFNARAAAIRVGFRSQFADAWAARFMEEPYVIKLIASRQQALAEDDREELEHTKRLIRSGLLKEAHYHGPGASHSARVSALAKLANIHEMDKTGSAAGEGISGGVMVVPGIADVDEWEKAAGDAQAQLQREALM